MHVTLSQLKAYHAKLKLSVGHCELTIIFPELRKPLRWTVLCVQDHLDPFWWSQHPLGGCEDGATAPNMSASAWHFAGRQIGKSDSVAGTLASFLPVQRQVVLAGELGLEMQLIVKWIKKNNVYTPEFAFDQNQVLPPTASAHHADVSSRWILRVLSSPQVVGKDSLRFYRKLFSYHYNVSNLRSLVWDGLDIAWLDGSDERELRTARISSKTVSKTIRLEDSWTPADRSVGKR